MRTSHFSPPRPSRCFEGVDSFCCASFVCGSATAGLSNIAGAAAVADSDVVVVVGMPHDDDDDDAAAVDSVIGDEKDVARWVDRTGEEDMGTVKADPKERRQAINRVMVEERRKERMMDVW